MINPLGGLPLEREILKVNKFRGVETRGL